MTKAKLHPVFIHIKNANTLEDAKSVFTSDGLSSMNVEKVYDSFHSGVLS